MSDGDPLDVEGDPDQDVKMVMNRIGAGKTVRAISNVSMSVLPGLPPPRSALRK
jgi:hypothetical protein